MSTPFYPKDSLGNELYLTNNEGDEYYLTQRKQVFAIKEDHTGKEIVYGKYIYKKDGYVKYPLNPDGHPQYETDDTTNDEVYVIKDGSINWGVDKNGNQRHAKKENGDEYYLENGEFACDQSGSPQYARTSDGKVIFPLDAEGNESYLKDDTNGESHVIYMGDVLLYRYAKTINGEEIYSVQATNQTPRRYEKVILNEKYAKTDLQEAKYPLDEYMV
ncbi:hypothetical protein TNIN_184061 [Trichonephila inaurata madagascariensis]|uniref:Uncharacterized protein n=1 Tax=Trichonephila inaurata madagascariensis TaxID=2747483 RepID=A0A8X6Y1Q7_9ARAC|nr:hypothetical protein TNIN_184061 [Trichonephila inaurata madagascariensis]